MADEQVKTLKVSGVDRLLGGLATGDESFLRGDMEKWLDAKVGGKNAVICVTQDPGPSGDLTVKYRSRTPAPSADSQIGKIIQLDHVGKDIWALTDKGYVLARRLDGSWVILFDPDTTPVGVASDRPDTAPDNAGPLYYPPGVKGL